jgi:peptidylprolyl isomerase
VFTAPASTAAAGSTALPGVPAVSGATDLTRQPTIAKGTGPAPTKLVTRDLVVGTGTAIDASATVGIRYVGTLYSNGTVFDTSWTQPATSAAPAGTAAFPLSGVVPGFGQGLVGMKIGGRREVVIPPALGYGGQATGSIPPNSTIVFVVDMLAAQG